MKYLVLENDHNIPKLLKEYIQDLKEESCDEHGHSHHNFTICTDIRNVSSEQLSSLFERHDVILFCPSMVTFEQYNFLMMLLHNLIVRKLLKVSEIHIFAYADMIEQELIDLWNDGNAPRKYIEIVQQHVNVFIIDPSQRTKKQIFL